MTKSNIIRAITLAVGVGAVLALTVSASASPRMTAASASGGGRVTIHPRVIGPAAIGLTTATPTSTRTFAGYQATVPAGSATVLVASFTVPTLSCTTTDRAIAPSVAVPENNSTTASAAFVFTGCVNGTALYYPGLVVNGTETDFQTSPFSAGDVIDLTTKVSTNRTHVQVTDVTTGVTQKIIGAGARASAAVIGDDAVIVGSGTGTLLHVPDFGKLTFKNCLIDAKALTSWHPHAFQRVNSLGTVQIATGGPFPGGTAFSTHFLHT
jgi:hypothetical protein